MFYENDMFRSIKEKKNKNHDLSMTIILHVTRSGY